MTQVKLARKSGVSVRAIIDIESGKRCRMDTKRKIMRALGLPFAAHVSVFAGESGRSAK